MRALRHIEETRTLSHLAGGKANKGKKKWISRRLINSIQIHPMKKQGMSRVRTYLVIFSRMCKVWGHGGWRTLSQSYQPTYSKTNDSLP